jgi:predicted nucleic acid-binding Zn ribbon protein
MTRLTTKQRAYIRAAWAIAVTALALFLFRENNQRRCENAAMQSRAIGRWDSMKDLECAEQIAELKALAREAKVLVREARVEDN